MLLTAAACSLCPAPPALSFPWIPAGESTPQWKNPVGEATGDEIDASELDPSSK